MRGKGKYKVGRGGGIWCGKVRNLTGVGGHTPTVCQALSPCWVYSSDQNKDPIGELASSMGKEAMISKCPSMLGDDECGRKTNARDRLRR